MSKIETPERDEVFETGEFTLERLIADQGVMAIDDLDQLAALWPADDDPDALMNFVRAEGQA